MPLNFLFRVSGQFKNSWRLETCLLLSLLSVPVSMAALVQGVSRRVLGAISCSTTSNVCFSLFLIYILGSALLHELPPGSSVSGLPSVPNSWDRQLSQNKRNYHYSQHNTEKHSSQLLMFLIMHKYAPCSQILPLFF
jgi:hypothetical protein